jgi:hypothetical protein
VYILRAIENKGLTIAFGLKEFEVQKYEEDG